MAAVARELGSKAEVIWLLREKDGMKELAAGMGLQFRSLGPAGRGLVRNAVEFLRATRAALDFARTFQIRNWFTKYGPGNIAAKAIGGKSISFNDDDSDVVPMVAWTSYPFADAILAPETTRMGRFAGRTRRYPGYHELAYLHPDKFVPDRDQLAACGIDNDQPYGVIRLSAMDAHHDVGRGGCTNDVLADVVDLMQQRGVRPQITSERPLPSKLEPFRTSVSPCLVHHLLGCASVYFGDSQTMASEAAVLGVPTVQLSPFHGRLSYIRDLNDRGLILGFPRDDSVNALRALDQLLADNPASARRWRRQRDAMLADKMDPAPFIAAQLLELTA